MTKNHPVRGYEIHPVFHDLLDGLTFDLRVGEMGSPLSRLYPIANHETFRKFGDPTQKNYVRPCE